MNYAAYQRYLQDHIEMLVSRFGVPRCAAEDIAKYAEVVGISEEAKERQDVQYEMNYRKHGRKAMAERYGITEQAAWKRHDRLRHKPNALPTVKVSVDG